MPAGREEPIDGRYLPQQRLGAGAAGEAWLCQDLQRGQPVVVKLLKRERAAAADAERFRREVLALAKVVHPHVVRILGAGTCPQRGQPYFAMSYSPGVTLKRVLQAEGRLAPRRALRLVQQLLAAVEAFHREGILHRDLKPENLLVQEPGTQREHLWVLDFGLAKHLQGGQRTQAELTGDAVVGTPLYLAPEQCRAREVTPATDVYAVGCILLELLSGAPPFSGSVLEIMRSHCQDVPPRLARSRPELGAELDELVAACLEKEPHRRPEAAAVRARLGELVASSDSSESETIDRPIAPVRDADLGGARTVADARVLPLGALRGPTEGTLLDGRVLPLPDAGGTLVDAGGTLIDGRVLTPPGAGGTLVDGRMLPLPGVPPEEALPAGPARRSRLELEGLGARVFVFVGAQLRFGRNGDGANDLLLRAYPRPGESDHAADERSRRVSGRHGRFVLTRRWIAVEDLGSTSGTLLDGRRLEPRRLHPLPQGSFRIAVPDGVQLEGRVVPAPEGAAHPVGGLRLTRVGEPTQGLVYLLLAGEVLLGSSPSAALPLVRTDVLERHATLFAHQGQLGLRSLAPDGAVQVLGTGPLRSGQGAPLSAGARVSLGRLVLRVDALQDADMKPL